MIADLNVNAIVTVRLTPAGREQFELVVRENAALVSPDVPDPDWLRATIEQAARKHLAADGVTLTAELWKLFAWFGPCMSMASAVPFEANRLEIRAVDLGVRP